VDLQALRTLPAEALLVPVLVQLAVILVAARAAGVAARRLGQPTVVGEILAGLLLGPSFLGWIAPGAYAFVFQPTLPGVDDALTRVTVTKIFETLKELGLVFLLFLIGLEFDFTHLRVRGRSAVAIMVVGTALPFALGAGLGPVIHGFLEPHPITGRLVPIFALTLFLGTALSVTALPVLGRMLVEWGVQRTRLAAVAIAAAAAGDAIGWVLLAAVAAAAKPGTGGGFDWAHTGAMAGLTVALILFVVFAVRPVLGRYFDRSLRAHNGSLSPTAFVVTIVAVLLAALATSLTGLFAIFGAFVLGAALSDRPAYRAAVTARVRDFVTGFFLPIFFTYTGLRTEVTTLADGTGWLICLVVVAAAVAGKLLGCGLAARATGFPAREAFLVGILMNTRGLMELVVANLGFALGVIPKSLFCTLVILTVVTTVMTTPLVMWLRKGTELDDAIRAGGFLTSTARGKRAATGPVAGSPAC
jgi:Kef-type K+ transport system membrane component KefB